MENTSFSKNESTIIDNISNDTKLNNFQEHITNNLLTSIPFGSENLSMESIQPEMDIQTDIQPDEEEPLENEKIGSYNRDRDNNISCSKDNPGQYTIFTPKQKNNIIDNYSEQSLIFGKKYECDNSQNVKEINEIKENETTNEISKKEMIVEESEENINLCLKKEENEKKEEIPLDEDEEKKKQEGILSNKKSKKGSKRNDHKLKRIKSNYCHHLIKCVNKKLKLNNIHHQFKKIPQCQVIDVAKRENKKVLNFTLKEFLLYKAFEKISHKKLKERDKEIEREIKREKAKRLWKENGQVLDILKVIKNENVEEILNIKMKDIYKEYLSSYEFQKSIEELKAEEKNYDYIHDYLILAKNVLKYYKVDK